MTAEQLNDVTLSCSAQGLKCEQEYFVINALPDRQLVKMLWNWSDKVAFL